MPGSAHGYDVVDPTRVRAELGGDDGLLALAAVARDHGLGIVLDIVPNHMAAHAANPWWWDVLRLGRASRFADVFDLDWDSPKRQLGETVLVPVLGDHYGRELEAGRIRVERGGWPGRVFVVRYGDHELPLAPTTTGALLAEVARAADDEVLGVAARVLARAEEHTTDVDARDADIAVAERTALVRLADPATGRAADATVAALGADVDRLDAALDRQHYRLAFWRVASDEGVYRRFFDIDSLVAVATDRADVFDQVHALPARLVAGGHVDVLRVDHVDGIRDPTAYLRRLRAAVGDTPILVEKILRPGEDLPDEWPVEGTTGYEVADLLGRWLTDPAGGPAVVEGWRRRTGEHRTYREVAVHARRLIATTSLAADIERVADALVRVCEGRRRHRDHSRHALRDAVVELAVAAPAYRSYVRFEDDDPARPVVTSADEAFVDTAVAGAREARPDVDDELWELLRAVLLGRLTGVHEADVALRFQQLTGPLAAKGEEDTALYRWQALPHRSEVGSEPSQLACTTEEVHAELRRAQQRWPRRLTTLSTHDAKRSADVRARLAVATTVPDRTLAAFDGWWAATAPWRGDMIDADTGWSVFHALVGAHPLPVERALAVTLKAAREAKQSTSWRDPDGEFETALEKLVAGAVDDPSCAEHVADLVAVIEEAGRAAALAQLLVQLFAPGVPDVYQGGESWDLSLVDPDNRRPVDAVKRQRLAASAAGTTVAGAWNDREARDDGVPRAAVLATALAVRRRHAAACAGAYVPLPVDGPDASRVVAFARGEPAEVVVVAARPGSGARAAAGARVALPEGAWREVLAGSDERDSIDLEGRALPLCLLERAAAS